MTTKEIDQIVNCIYKYFGFLFGHGYEIVYTQDAHSFDNVLIVLESRGAKIRFLQDRSEISMYVGPVWAQNNWSDPNYEDLRVIMGFLENYSEIKNYEGDLRDKAGQVKRLAEMFYPQFEKIVSMFQADAFSQTKDALNTQRQKMIDNFSSKFR